MFRLASRSLFWLLVCALLGAATAYAATLTVTPYKLTQRQQAMTYAGKTCTVSSSQDSWVNQASSGSNYGNDTTMQGGLGYCGCLCTNAVRQMLVQFDLSSCNISSNSTVTSATLSLYSNATNLSGTRNFRAARNTASWAEGSVTWSNKPATTDTNAPDLSISNGSSAWNSWNVTTHVNGFVQNSFTNYGWTIRDTGSAPGCCCVGVNNSRQWRTSEHGTSGERPQLVINYDP